VRTLAAIALLTLLVSACSSPRGSSRRGKGDAAKPPGDAQTPTDTPVAADTDTEPTSDVVADAPDGIEAPEDVPDVPPPGGCVEGSECPSGFCIEGECVNCFPGARRCTENLAETCDAAGEAWELTEDCSLTGFVCLQGVCIDPCDPDYKLNLGDLCKKECDLQLPEPGEIAIDDACTSVDAKDLTEDPWNIVIEWQWEGNGGAKDVIVMPAVGNLSDDNGDGKIDDNDTPDIAAIAYSSAWQGAANLVILDGATGAELWNKPGFSGDGGHALADVDGDGQTDIIAFALNGDVIAMDHTGKELWTAPGSNAVGPQATVADLDGDGTAEVIADNVVIDGVTGVVEKTFAVTSSIAFRMPAVGDIDLDGEQELIIGNTCYSLSKGQEWSAGVTGSFGHWSAIVDYDGDPGGEVAMIGGGQYAVYDSDGTQLVSKSVGTSKPGPPCVADFNGDGAAEIAWASSGTVQMVTLDGNVLWTAPVKDSSGLAGCSGYDFNGDGIYELLFADEIAFHVFNGATGALDHKTTGHASGTLWEYPVVADVDNDGSAEIVIASNNNAGGGGWRGITVLGHKENGWMKSGTTWHVHDFAVTNINSDGTVPAEPEKPWQVYNVYRARPAVDKAAVDLTIEIVEACWTGCGDEDTISATALIGNQGSLPTFEGLSVSAYAMDSDALAGTFALPSAVGPGTQIAMAVDFPAAIVGAGGFRLVVDDTGMGAGLQPECDEQNNLMVWAETDCE